TRAVAFAAFAFAMPVLAGHPETAAHLTLTAVAFAAVTWSASNFESRFAYRFLAAGLLAGGLASIQMFPTIEWLQQLPKAFDLSWPPQPLHHILAWVSRDATASHNSAGIWIPEGAAYIGMITLIAAPVGLLHRSKRHVWFLGGLTLLSLAIAYGIDPIYSVAAHVPILAGLKNSRMLLLAGFGIAALAGLGISTLEDELPSIPRHRFAALALILISFAVAFLLVYELRLATVTRVELLRRPSFSRALLLVGVIPLLLRLYGKLSRSAFTTAVCAILAFDLLTFSYGYMGFANRDEIFPRAGVFGFLEKNADPAQSRVVQIDGPFPPNANMVYGAASADGYEVRLAALHRAFSFDYMENRMDGFFYTAGRLLRFNDRRLDLMNVRYLVLPATSPEFNRLLSTARFKLAYNNGYVAAFENKTVLPRAFLVAATGVKVLAEVDDQLAVLRADDFDPQRTFTVSDLPQVLKQQPAPQPESGAPLTRNVDTLSSGINGMTLRCTSPERSVLILSQTYYPGWVAEIDGQRTEVFRADITLTGISVPAGVHIVRVAFRPPSFTLGTILTIVSTLFVVVLVRR
ncbi:MAG TPA: YfhO family protein, partial [Terriglobia bacterium]|nr:YfhO family protein [Terriglobia bacterium]